MNPRAKPFIRYVAAPLLAALALGFRLWFQPYLGFEDDHGALLGSVVLASIFVGLGPSLLLAGVGVVAVGLAVHGSVVPHTRDEIVGLLFFIGESIAINVVIEHQRSIQARLRMNKELSNQLLEKYQTELTERKRFEAAERRHALWLEVTLSSIGDGLIVTDNLGIVTYSNAAAAKITRLSASAARGKAADDLLQLIDEQTGESLPSPIYQTLNQPRGALQSARTALIVAPGDTRIPVLVSSAVMREASGAVTGAVFVFHDLTHIRESEASRADSERRFVALADAVPALIWVSDSEGAWEYFNSAWEELTGYPPEEQRTCGWTKSIHPEDEARCRDVYSTALKNRTPFEMELRLLDRAGKYRWVVNRGLPRYASDGRFAGFLGSCIDVTYHKEAEEASRLSEERFRLLNAELDRFTGELARANVELELQNCVIQRANDQKTRFLATMSHELRTPMNAVIGFVSLLSEESAGPLTEKQHRFLSHIRRAGDHLLRIVENILDYSRIEAGHLQLDCQEFEARPVIQEIVAEVSQIDREKPVRVSIDVATDFVLFADHQRFRQILYNLASNALKFTPRDGRITISARRDESFAYVSVRDTGVGIAPDQLASVFEEFQQARSIKQNKGAGLGLAITQRLVQAQGGTIAVESEVDHGSCFTFSLPLARGRASAAPRVDGRAPLPPASSGNSEAASAP